MSTEARKRFHARYMEVKRAIAAPAFWSLCCVSIAESSMAADEELKRDDVRLEKVDGAWTVFLVEDGKITQQTFETKKFARNFASGQRIRLGLKTSKLPQS
jgi:hypothetical protein